MFLNEGLRTVSYGTTGLGVVQLSLIEVDDHGGDKCTAREAKNIRVDGPNLKRWGIVNKWS